ncbi:MAG: hypothetical protein ABJL99_04995 [Aliishimia sp.]
MTQSLDARLLAAHEMQDQSALIDLYEEAASNADTEDACGFYLTHAYVFALESGDRRAAVMREKLVALDREPAP